MRRARVYHVRARSLTSSSSEGGAAQQYLQIFNPHSATSTAAISSSHHPTRSSARNGELTTMATIVPMHDEWHKPRAMPMRIPKGVSQPADQDCPSLLTTLSPEIRNEVYRWLLVREEPIIYDGCRSDREREPSFDRDYQFDRYYDYDEMESSRELSQEELTILRQPSHDIGSCVPLLRSCRQIYFEAIGILYSANSFLISANPHQHNAQMTQIYTAANFLTSLGSQINLLKEVSIDITKLCPEDCNDVDRLSSHVDTEQIDVLPLVRVLWSQPKVAQIISLTCTARNFDRRVHPCHGENDLGHDIEPLVLEQIIRALGSDNALGVVGYGRFERLLRNVWIRRYLDWGWVTHPIPSLTPCPQAEAEVVRAFDITTSPHSGSANLGWRSWAYDSKLHMFPQSVQARIQTHAIQSGDDIVFDMDGQSAHGLDCGLLHLNRDFRYSMQQQAANGNQITVSFATSEVRTDFSNYASLRRWLEHSISKVYPLDDTYDASSKIPPRIALDFDIPRPKLGLADLRVNVTSFIRLTYHLLAQSMIVVRIKTKEGGIKVEYAISLETLRQRCFVFISEMVVNRSAQNYQPCPELWINGYGTVLEAGGSSNEASQHGRYHSNSYAELDHTDLLGMGREYATKLERRPAPMLPVIIHTPTPEYKSPNAVRLQRWRFSRGRKPNQALRECDDLRSMWISLKDLDWSDEQGHDVWDDIW
jgi:hypothetical protein